MAYKAETNFVDIVPQAKHLRLSLNMPFPDIVDSRNICKDVTGFGRWGNRDVEVVFSSEDELPHIMSLITQSFERQMGNGERCEAVNYRKRRVYEDFLYFYGTSKSDPVNEGAENN